MTARADFLVTAEQEQRTGAQQTGERDFSNDQCGPQPS